MSLAPQSATEQHPGRPFVGLAEAAHHYQVSQRTIRRMIAEGELRAYHVGRQVRIKHEDLEALATPIPATAS